MASVVSFDTIPQLFLALEKRYRTAQKTAFAFKPSSNDPYQEIKWDQFAEDVYTLAAYMLEEGIEKGDRVALLSENRYEWAVVDYALELLGAVNVALYATLPSNQCEYILQDSGARLFFVSSGVQQKKAIDVFEQCPDLKKVVAFDEPNVKSYLEKPFMSLFATVMSEAKALKDKHMAAILERANAVKKEDLATLIYTSGTTGLPKGAMLTHDNIVSNIHACMKVIEIFETDKALSFLPLCHAFERTGGYYAVMSCGAEIWYAESVDTVAKNLGEARPTVLVSVPRLFERIYNLILKSLEDGSAAKKAIFNWALSVGKKYSDGQRGFISFQKGVADKLVFNKLKERTGGNIRFFVSGGAALGSEVGNFFMSAGLPIIEGYGLTETAPVLTANHLGKQRIGTVGYVVPGVTVAIQRLVDGKIIAQLTGEDYPTTLTSEAGEIICKGPNIMKGYWKKDDETAKMIDSDGWLHTGDIGRFVDGYLQITDRLKHMIVNAGGKNIYPGPIEDTLKTSMWIDQVVVLGEGKGFMTTLIVPDFEMVKKFAKDNAIAFDTIEALLQHEQVQAVYDKELRNFNKALASHEKIRKFTLLANEFTVETGEMTPTLKVKRKVIEQKYKTYIDQMYVDDVA